MKFTLHYSGPLRANGRPDHKHELRRAFHAQLAELWRHEPLSHMKSHLRPRDSPDRKPWETVSLLRQLGQYTFVPIVSGELKFVASLDVTVLRPEQPGRLLVQGGDMDNRLRRSSTLSRSPRTKINFRRGRSREPMRHCSTAFWRTTAWLPP